MNRASFVLFSCACLLFTACDGADGEDGGASSDAGAGLDGAASDAGTSDLDAAGLDAAGLDAAGLDAALTDGGVGGDAGPSPTSTCEAYARHLCQPSECSERIYMHLLGGEGRCLALFTQACVAATLDGATLTPGDLDRCAGSIACFREETDPYCLALRETVGERAEGAPCVTTNQCGMADGRPMICRTSTPYAAWAAGMCEPGLCTATLATGEACDPSASRCQPLDNCEGPAGDERCTAITRDVPLGGACDSHAFCGINTRCGPDDRCVDYVPEGGACDPLDFGACALGRGLSCVGGVCTDRGRLIGEACGPDDRCPLAASECRAGVCVDIAQPAGGACTSLADCEQGLGCDMDVCRNVSCDP